jgi:hypothetical protein
VLKVTSVTTGPLIGCRAPDIREERVRPQVEHHRDVLPAGVPAQALRVPTEGEGRSMPEEIGRWNEVGPRYGLDVVGPPIPKG